MRPSERRTSKDEFVRISNSRAIPKNTNNTKTKTKKPETNKKFYQPVLPIWEGYKGQFFRLLLFLGKVHV